MRTETYLIAFLCPFLLPLVFYGQDDKDSVHLRQEKVRVKHQKSSDVLNDRWNGYYFYTDSYYNRTGRADSIVSSYDNKQVAERSAYIYNRYGARLQVRGYDPANPDNEKRDTTHFSEKGKKEYDAKGNVIVGYYPGLTRALDQTCYLHYDSLSRFIGRECYDVKGNITWRDKKAFSKTGKLSSWHSYDHTNQLSSYNHYRYDVYDSLILEVDSFSWGKRTGNYAYITINGARQLKYIKHYKGKRLQYKDVYAYRSGPDGSYTQKHLRHYYYKHIPLVAKKTGRSINYYLPTNLRYKEELYGKKRRLEQTGYYSNHAMDSTISGHGGATTLTRFHKGKVSFKLELTAAGDTTLLEEYIYNEKDLLLKSRVMHMSVTGNADPRNREMIRNESINEYWYEYY